MQLIVVVRQLPDSQMEMLEKQLGIQDRWRAQSFLHDHKAVDMNELTNSGTDQRGDVRSSRESVSRKESSWPMADNFMKRTCRIGPVKVNVIARKSGEGESTKEEAMAMVNTPKSYREVTLTLIGIHDVSCLSLTCKINIISSTEAQRD